MEALDSRKIPQLYFLPQKEQKILSYKIMAASQEAAFVVIQHCGTMF